MIKGVNKQIIEINDMDNKLFEKAVLYVRPECSDVSEAKLHNSAKEFAKELSDWDLWCLSPQQTETSKKTRMAKRKIILSLLLTGVIVAAVVYTLLTVI